MKLPIVKKINGEIVLEDPMSLEVARAIAKSNCRFTYEDNLEKVAHFKRRAVELNKVDTSVIIFINVDDSEMSRAIADILVPGADWQQFRNMGQIPFARGIAVKDGIQEAIAIFDKDAAEKLDKYTDLPVVIIDYGTVEIF